MGSQPSRSARAKQRGIRQSPRGSRTSHVLVLLAMCNAGSGAEGDAAPASRRLWPAILSLVLGVASVLFRDVIEYVLGAAIPSAQPRFAGPAQMAEAIAGRITCASVAIAICVLVALRLTAHQLRRALGSMPSRAALRRTAVFLVVSFAVPINVAITLQSYSRRNLDVAVRGAAASTVLP